MDDALKKVDKSSKHYNIEEPINVADFDLSRERLKWLAKRSNLEREINYRWCPQLKKYVQRKWDGEQNALIQHVVQMFGDADAAGFVRCKHKGIKIVYGNGRAGSGKTETINNILLQFRLMGVLTAVSAPTALAANLYEDGITVHALGKFNVLESIGDIISSGFTLDDPRCKFLANCGLIVIDEAPNMHRAFFEAVFQLLERIGFNGCLLLGGDFRCE